MTLSTQEQQSFVEYCAEVMGWHEVTTEQDASVTEAYWCDIDGVVAQWLSGYNPYADLNQLAPVVERLMKDNFYLFETMWKMQIMTFDNSIRQAFIDFVLSVMEKQA